jgi:predicted nucleic acid-binding protein
VAFVVDASVAIAWALQEVHPTATLALGWIESDSGVVPSLWWFEARNALVQNERRGRLTEPRTAVFLHELARLAISLDHDPHESMLLTISRRHRLTVYDAAYLELAIRSGLPLATLDAALVRAAQAEQVPLIGATA